MQNVNFGVELQQLPGYSNRYNIFHFVLESCNIRI